MPATLVLFQVISAEGIPHGFSINGFPADSLPSIRADERAVSGLATRLERYYVLHPYFLRPGANRIEATYHLNPSHIADDDQGPWTFSCRIATVRHDPAKAAYATEYADKELAALVAPPLTRVPAAETPHEITGSFTLGERLPVWSWTTGVKIPATPAVKAGLHAEYLAFHQALAALHSEGPVAAGDAKAHADSLAGLTRSTAEYIRACESRGVRYAFLDELFRIAERLEEPWFAAELARQRAAAEKAVDAKPPVAPVAAVLDGSRPLSAEPDKDGKMPPHLTLAPLPPIDELNLVVFAGGALAKLTGKDGEPIIAYYSNYPDGPWNRRGTTKLSAELWYRRGVDGAWAIDAVRDMKRASLETTGAIDEALENGGF